MEITQIKSYQLDITAAERRALVDAICIAEQHAKKHETPELKEFTNIRITLTAKKAYKKEKHI